MDNSGEFDTNLKLIAKSSVIVFFGIFISKIATYLYRILIARGYGAEVYGLFSLGLMAAGFVGAIASLGLVDGIIRYVPIYRGEGKKKEISFILNSTIKILLFFGIIGGLILYFTADFISLSLFKTASLAPYLRIFGLLIPFSQLSNFLLSLLRSYEKISSYSFNQNILQSCTKLGTIFLFILFGFNGLATVYSQFIAIIVSIIFSYFILRKEFHSLLSSQALSKRLKKNIFSDLFSYSWPIMAVSIIYSVFYWVDSFTIGYFLGAEEVGFYNAAIPIAILLMFIPELFMQLFLPLINREYGMKNRETIKQLSKQVNKWIFMLNLPVFIIVFTFPGALINLLFGSEYLIAESSLRILSCGVFISSLSVVSQNLLSMSKKSKLLMINVIVATAINIILNFILVPRMGISGAAIGTSASFFLLSLFIVAESIYYEKFTPIRRKFLNILIAGLFSIFLLVLLRSFLEINLLISFILVFIFMIFYLLLIIIFKVLDKHDLFIKTVFLSKFFSISGKKFK